MTPPRATIAILLAGVLAAAPAAAQQGAPAPKVTVVTLKAQDITVTSTLPGRVVASGEAEVRPQVSGIITERLFEEGKAVTKGDPLYRIDDASYGATVAAANASVAQAEAALSSAKREEKRVESLLQRNVASEQARDDAVTAREQAEAGVKVAQAQLLSANIDLDRTTIRAPLSGTVGLSQTTQGALVTAGQQAALAVIRTLDPVYVDVTQSAEELIRWRRGNTEAALDGADQTVTLGLADGSTYEHTGQLTAAEPHVDEQTGVIVLRLTFPNPDEFLLPGMYVQVAMPQGVVKNAVLAPQQGVSRDRRGNPTALVVNDQNVVEARELTVLRDRGSDWVVTAGLKAGDKLIVSGFQKIAPGATVVPEEQAAVANPADTAANAPSGN